jgi:hypothetical protein
MVPKKLTWLVDPVCACYLLVGAISGSSVLAAARRAQGKRIRNRCHVDS